MKRFNVHANICIFANTQEEAQEKITHLLDDNQDSFDWYEIVDSTDSEE